MKYALNHPWKFNRQNIAILTGLMGVIVAVIIELTTFYILAYQSDSAFDILANYAIVLVIVDFDSNFYTFEGSQRLKSLITDEKYKSIWKIEVTTSYLASDEIDENKLQEEFILPQNHAEQRPEYIRVGWLSRTWDNKMLYLLYRLLTIINNSVWYYFAPIICF